MKYSNDEVLVYVENAMEANESKDDIMIGLYDEFEMKPSISLKFFKDNEIKFKRGKGNTWRDLAIEAFKENPDLSREAMAAAIAGSTKDATSDAYYVKTWYEQFSTLAKI